MQFSTVYTLQGITAVIADVDVLGWQTEMQTADTATEMPVSEGYEL